MARQRYQVDIGVTTRTLVWVDAWSEDHAIELAMEAHKGNDVDPLAQAHAAHSVDDDPRVIDICIPPIAQEEGVVS